MLLQLLSHQQQLLPGAALKPAHGWGVENILQRPRKFLSADYSGHIMWMREFSQGEAVATIVLILAASVAGWYVEKG